MSIEEVLSSVGLVHFAATDQEKSLAARVVTAEQRVAAVERERDEARSLAQFGLQMLDAHRNGGMPGDIDGFDAEAKALDCGVLVEVAVEEACGLDCPCRDVDDFPQTCIRYSDGALAFRAALAAAAPATLPCPKAPHIGTGYMHDESDDTPYSVDGLLYCGRCHFLCNQQTGECSRPITPTPGGARDGE